MIKRVCMTCCLQVSGLVDDVKCAALQCMSAIPPEVRQIVLSKLEPCRWSKHHAWVLQLAPQEKEVLAMPTFHGWPSRHLPLFLQLQMGAQALPLPAAALLDADDYVDLDDQDNWIGNYV